jgi:hypothetical protein
VCLEREVDGESYLIVVVSDGAGTSTHGGRGANIVCKCMAKSLSDFIGSGGLVSDIDEDLARSWLEISRAKIQSAASLVGLTTRDFAATLVSVIISRDAAAIIQVGDGACAHRCYDADDWNVALWPARGEYAASTFFVTELPKPSVRVALICTNVDKIAVFTDGIEKLVLNEKSKKPFKRFFETVMLPVINSNVCGRDRYLSHRLRDYLNSDYICDRTDDDKTLVLATRRDSN